MQLIIQMWMALVGSLCFSMIFNVRGWRALMNAVLGTLCYAAYLAMSLRGLSVFAAFFAASLLAELGCEVLARKSHTPLIMMLFPVLVPLIPGSDLYRSMYALIQGDMVQGWLYGQRLIAEIAAINFAIVTGSSLSQILQRLHRLRRLPKEQYEVRK